MHSYITHKNKNPLVYLAKKMWQYSEGNRRTVVLFVCMFIVADILWALEPLVVGFILNEIQEKGLNMGNVPYIFSLLLIFLFLDIIAWAFHGPARVMETKNAFRVRANYKKYLLQGTMALPIDWHSNHHSGDIIDKIEKGSSAVSNFSENTFQVIQAVVTLLAGVLALLYYDAVATAAMMLLLLPTFFIIAHFDKQLIPGYKKVSAMDNETSAKVFDALSNVVTVIILRVESLVFHALDISIHSSFAQYGTNAKLNEMKWFSASVLGRLAAVTVIGVYLWRQLITGTAMLGTLFILYGYVDRIRGVFFQFAYLYNDIVRYRASVSNAEDLSKDFRETLSYGANRMSKGWDTLAIENLSFSYDGKDAPTDHIVDVSMRIKKGERIALIGESGGGKSTFLKLVRDLYHPKTLSLSLDDTLMTGGFVHISDSISLVPQDPEVFATTIRENITLGVDYTESHIAVFTDMARFTDVVKRLPKGLESSIVEKGVNLSGGEKQRLALSRGLLASEDKDIILLDEPTSSVDFGNELSIYQNIFESFPRKAIISSIHRLHLLSLFDSVYFFKRGRIVASGSFEVLKEKSAEFQELWDNYIRARDAAGE
ncbi:ABC transporter ATP-binding protein [Candidatus Kaiserbacteria bacterium]|nr:ABC transporter ATP-binding protein [Candidatus Kaiserbacteria bacterium]